MGYIMIRNKFDEDYVKICEELIDSRSPQKYERLKSYKLGKSNISLSEVRNRLVDLKVKLMVEAFIKKAKKLKKSEWLKLKNNLYDIFSNNKYLKKHLPKNYIIFLKKKRPVVFVTNNTIYDTIVKLKVEFDCNGFETYYY